MSNLDGGIKVNRRRVLALGGGAAAGTLLSGALPVADAAGAQQPVPASVQHAALPVEKIEAIVQAQGTATKGVLSIDIERKDVGDVVGPLGVTFTPAFEVNGTLTFQPLSRQRAFFNGDLPLKPSETQPFIDAIIANGLIFQAYHQHYIETRPNVWFIHFRGHGDPLKLAHAVHKVMKTTSTPLPQKPPSNPTTPLNPKRLASILHGDAQVGDEGVVTVTIDRTDPVVIDGIRVSPRPTSPPTCSSSQCRAPGQAPGPDRTSR